VYETQSCLYGIVFFVMTPKVNMERSRFCLSWNKRLPVSDGTGIQTHKHTAKVQHELTNLITIGH